MRGRSWALGLVMVVLALVISPGRAFAQANDPYQGPWSWPRDYTGTYRVDSSITLAWMKNSISYANAVIGHSAARNPDFHATTSSSANGVVLKIASGPNCLGGPGPWVGCAKYSPGVLTWEVWLQGNVCWTDGTNNTCTTSTRFDVQTVMLNELGHVNTLAHHLPETGHDTNPDYDDAVVQAVPDPVGTGHPFGTNRSLRWADIGALRTRYGSDPCTIPPCPVGAER